MQPTMTEAHDDQDSRYRLQTLLKGMIGSRYAIKIQTLIKILVGLALLFISIRGIKWENLLAGIRSARLLWIVMAIALVILGLMLKFVRWSRFIRNYHLTSSNSFLFRAYFVGQAVNIIFPFRGGELIRLGYFSRNPYVIPEVASTIVLEKYLDLLALTIVAALVSITFSIDHLFTLRLLFLPLLAALTLLLIVVILLGPALWQKIRTRNLLPSRCLVWLDHYVQVSQWMRNPRLVLPGVVLTFFIWVIMWLTNMVLFASLGLPLRSTAASLVLILVYIGLLPALMPGNIGPFYFFASLALVPFDVVHDQAILYAVVLHAIVTIPPLLAGLVGLWLSSDRVAAR